MPFDQFTVEQLAGDLLPESTVGKDRIRFQPQPCDYGRRRNCYTQVEYAVDRVKTTANAWMD